MFFRYFLPFLFIGIIFFQGFLLGHFITLQNTERENLFYYKNLRKFENEIADMDDYALCLKLGGMPQHCASLMHGTHKTSQD